MLMKFEYKTKTYPIKTKKEAFIDFENYNDERIQYSFNAEITKLKKQLNEANEKIEEMNSEITELRTEINTLRAIADE